MDNMPSEMSQSNMLKVLILFLLFLIFIITTILSGYWFYVGYQYGLKEPELEMLIEEAPWKDYKNESVGLEFKCPQDFSVEQEGNSLTIYSPQYLCRVKGSSDSLEKTSEITINTVLHQGGSFEEIWLDTFGFPFTGEGSYDGVETIGGKKAYYFYQGAEMPFGRKTYLIELTPTKALEVNIFTPSYAFECEDQIQEFSQHLKYTNLANQILSTFKFFDQF